MIGSATGSPGRFALPLAAERVGARSDDVREKQGGAPLLSHWELLLAVDFGSSGCLRLSIFASRRFLSACSQREIFSHGDFSSWNPSFSP